MEPAFQAHPVPQNVTNFEFHLIGDMTIKQFGYLAAGLIFAFITFVALAQRLPFLAWPIILVSSGIGAAFAFIPIQERPLDHWVAAFFKAIFKPTKLVYAPNVIQKDDPYFTKRLLVYKNSHHDEPITNTVAAIPAVNASGKKQSLADRMIANQDSIKTQAMKEVEMDNLVSKTTPQPAPVNQMANPVIPQSPPAPLQPQVIVASASPPTVATPPAPKIASTPKELKPQDLKKTVELAKEAQETQAKIQQIEAQLSQIKATVARPGADPKYYVDQFQSLLTDLQKLNEHASDIAHNLAVVSKTEEVAHVQNPVAEPAKIVPTVKLTSFANVINGIITDSQGNYVEGAIIVAHDKHGLPVRALKSNKLGQFVAATPLPSGQYTIVVEKESLVFDNVSIDLKNDLLQPVMISAKKQQIIPGVAGVI